MMKILWTSLITLALAQGAASQERSPELEKAVWDALKAEKLDEEVAEVLVADGTAVLRGKPSNAHTKMKAIEAALSVEGVEAVEDELEIATAESTEEFVTDLRNAVLSYPHYTVFDDIGFQIQGEGLVVLTGWVTMGHKKTDIEQRVGKVRGVQELKSVIEVLPGASSDDELRERLFRNIYGHEIFVYYSRRTHKPIRIIVNGPNVMLTGAVRNRIEKMQAESIARSTWGVVQVDNRLQIAN